MIMTNPMDFIANLSRGSIETLGIKATTSMTQVTKTKEMKEKFLTTRRSRIKNITINREI